MSEITFVIENANVITLNRRQPRAEAIAIRENRIIAVRSNGQIRPLVAKGTRIIDAKGKTVVPGLVDCHVHMMGFGSLLRSIQLTDVRSIRKMQDRIREFSRGLPKRTWIQGGRWDHELLAERRYPTRFDLDEAAPSNPVFLMRICGHVGVANSMALRLAGITRNTKVVSGKIEIDKKTGRPNGVLWENALDLIRRVIPKPSEKQLEPECLLACQKAAEAGLTCVHWLVNSTKEVKVIRKLFEKGDLPVRVRLGLPVEKIDAMLLGLGAGFRNDMIRFGFVKILADGSLGGHSAALKMPYSDQTENCGMMLYTQKELDAMILKAHHNGFQLGVHAIGDKAIDETLSAYEKALKKEPRQDHRHRIEHASVLDRRLIERMKRLNAIASVQPHFATSDFWIQDRLGHERGKWVYPFETLIKKGVVVISGSDCPVEPISPVLGIWSASNRKDNPAQAITAEEALRTYTLNAAFASFDDTKLGTVEKGKLADLTMLSDDIVCCDPEEIKNITVEMTIVDGKITYSRENAG